MKHCYCEWSPGTPPNQCPSRYGDSISATKIEHISLYLMGRLDDRINLSSCARCSPLDTDEELLINAYLNCGIKILDKLVGDFSLIMYDERQSSLFIARDYVGSRPLFYCIRPNDKIVVATRLADLLPNGLQNFPLNEKYIANYLTYDMQNYSELTPFRGIYRVRPGHYVRWTNSVRPTVERLWEPSTKKIVYQNQEDYVEHFKEIFISSVSDRLRGASVIGVDLSGGLDSSSVACVAAINSSQRRVVSVSQEYHNDVRADERPYIDSVLQKYPVIKHVSVSGLEHWIFRDANTIPPFDEPNASSLFHSQTAANAIASIQNGATVHLTGYAGDVVLGFQAHYLGHLLLNARWRELFKDVRTWSRHKGQSGGRIFLTGAVYPLLPFSIKKFIATRQVPTQLIVDHLINPPPSWILPKLRQLVDPDPILTRYQPYDLATNMKALYKYADMSYHDWNVFLMLGLEPRHPFLDRRLVDFMFRVPGEKKMNAPYLKTLLRQAMKGILPERIRTRSDKGELSVVVATGLRREQAVLWKWAENPLVSEYGFVDRKVFQTMLKHWSFGIGSFGEYYQLFGLEHWLRTINNDLIKSTTETNVHVGSRGLVP